MKLHRTTLAAAPVIVATLALALTLTGCGFLAPTPPMTPSPTLSPSPTVIDTTAYIGEVIDPVDTVWAGRDSGGDDTGFTLRDDGTVAVQYATNRYDDPNDTWHVSDGILHIDIYLDDTNGEAQYVGTWNPKTSSIDAVVTTTMSERSLTVTLVQQ